MFPTQFQIRMKIKDALLMKMGCEPCPTPGEEIYPELPVHVMTTKPKELEGLFERPKGEKNANL